MTTMKATGPKEPPRYACCVSESAVVSVFVDLITSKFQAESASGRRQRSSRVGGKLQESLVCCMLVMDP